MLQFKIYNLQISNLYWICENNISIKFNTATTPYPDSTRTELEAIISLLLTIPNNTHINIHLDNNTAIKNLKQTHFSKTIQNKNWDIIFIINQIKSIKNIL